MSLLDVEYPLVLTPRTIAGLNGRLEPSGRETLLALTREAIAKCFVPFARFRGRDSSQALQRAIEMYSPYRILLLRMLLKIFGPQGLNEVCRRLQDYVGSLQSQDWTRIGADSRRVRALFGSYFKTVSRFLADWRRISAWPDTSPAFIRLVDSLWVGSTTLDFCLTALVLAVESEIALQKSSLRALMERARWAVRHVSKDIEALCRRPSRLDEYFYQILLEQGLVLPFSGAEDTGKPPEDFEPIAVRGEPVSRTLLRDRR